MKKTTAPPKPRHITDVFDMDDSNARAKPVTSKKSDPITGAPDYHPVGTSIGAATGGALGAAAGAAAGPAGMLVGAAVGGLAGGILGKTAASDYEENYWRDSYTAQPYYRATYTFDDYDPAYRYGHEAFFLYRGSLFEEVEPELEKGWEKRRGSSRLTWENAKDAVRRAWNRVRDSLSSGTKNGLR